MLSLPLTFEEIYEKSLELGFDDAGVTKPKIPQEDIEAYLQWLKKGRHSDLKYMENEIRCHPEKLLPGAKSAFIFVSYYKQEKKEFLSNKGVVASYARGKDYHNVHHSRLKKFTKWLRERVFKEFEVKRFSDSTPILERALAVQAGLGWFGKNTLLIHRKFGTYTLLSGLLTTLEFEGKETFERLPRCGSCTRCIDACPTNALSPYELDAAKCLSYHLIESKGEIPQEIVEKNPGYIFGCDICQEACPHNFRKPLSKSQDFQEPEGVGGYIDFKDIERYSHNPETLYGTVIKRSGPNRLKTVLNLLSIDS